MSETLCDAVTAALTGGAATGSVQSLRVDAAHPIGDHEPQSSSPADAAATAASLAGGEPSTPQMVAVIQQLRLQAEQLSMHLRLQEKDLSQREAQLHARSADVDNQARATRLWIRERNVELAQREAELEHIARELEEQRHEHEAQRHASSKEAARFARMMGQTSVAESTATSGDGAIERCAQSVLEIARALGGDVDLFPPATPDTIDELTPLLAATLHLAQSWGSRARHLVDGERLLKSDQARLDEERQALTRARQQHELRQRVDLRKATEQQRQVEADLEKRRQLIEARAAQLQSRREALEELRGDVMRVHRESLEMRLATEETWAQLSAGVPPATLTQSLGRIRAQLAEHYRDAAAELAKGHKEVADAVARLQQQQDRLALQKSELQSWQESREAELRQQADRLVQRERQLDGLEHAVEQERQQRVDEGKQYQAEIRRLLTELRDPVLAATSV